jgi:hypothetical protein
MTGHNSSLKQFIEHKKSLERRWGASIRPLPAYLIRNFGIRKALKIIDDHGRLHSRYRLSQCRRPFADASRTAGFFMRRSIEKT